MEKLSVSISQHKTIMYPVFIGEHILEKIAVYVDMRQYTNKVLVADLHVSGIIIEKILKGLGGVTDIVVLSPGDKNKTIENVQRIWEVLQRARCDRKSLLISVGG